jgi:4-hydroxy-tetrahydrodipicolinate reductase
MLRVVLSGATGKVGRVLEPALRADPELELAALAAPSLGVTLAQAIAGGADVAVDFTVPEAALDACRTAIEHRVPMVLGTSGLGSVDRELVDRAAADAGVQVLYAPNFAIGAVLMMRMAALARPLMPACEVIELHADTKRDAPSGTAHATAELLGGAPVHSVRLPGLVAHQEVLFGATGQTLSIRHDTTSREAFVPGVLLAVRRIRDLRPGLTVGLDAILPELA